MFQINIESVFSDDYRKMIKRMQDSQMEALRSSLSPLLKGIREDFSLGQTEEFKKLLETIEHEAEELPEYVNKIHSYFAQRGWFISFYSASIHSFKLYAELIDEEEHELIAFPASFTKKLFCTFFSPSITRALSGRGSPGLFQHWSLFLPVFRNCFSKF